jgi:hypothetical protein
VAKLIEKNCVYILSFKRYSIKIHNPIFMKGPFSLLAIFLLIFCSCKKESVPGPQGEPGPQGAPGISNIIYSDWLQFPTESWKDTMIYNLAYKRAIIDLPPLSQEIYDKATVLLYVKFSNPSTNVTMMPFTFRYNNLNTYETHSFIMQVGKLIITFQNVTNGVVNNYQPVSNRYRYVIIPSGAAPVLGSVNPVNYEDVCEKIAISY